MINMYDLVLEKFIPEIPHYNFIPNNHFINWLQTYGDGISTSKISSDAKIHPTAIIENSIIEDGVEIYEGCTIRNSYIGHGTIIGHGSEIARSVVLSECMIPRFNYIGTSLIGERVRLGGCVMFATRRHDDKDAKIRVNDEVHQTSLWKIGSIVGSDSILGYGCHVNPGCMIGKNVIVGALVDIAFNIEPNKIVKIRQHLDLLDNPQEGTIKL